MVKGIVNNTTNIIAIAKDFAGLILRPGQVFTGVVLAKETQLFWLKTGETFLPVRSEKPLEVGDLIKLRVLGYKGEDVLVEKLPLLPEEVSSQAKSLDKLIEKYGPRGEKETAMIKEAVLKIPVEENTAVRYLLDPYLFAALLLPQENRTAGYNKIEIAKYRGAMLKEDVWEVGFQLQMPVLQNIEIKLKMQAGNIYVQIWTNCLQTEHLLQERKMEIESFCTKVEIIPVAEGPLIAESFQDNIDLMV